jgi:hypothetical protein
MIRPICCGLLMYFAFFGNCIDLRIVTPTNPDELSISGTGLCWASDHQVVNCDALPGFTCTANYKKSLQIQEWLDEDVSVAWTCTTNGCDNEYTQLWSPSECTEHLQN